MKAVVPTPRSRGHRRAGKELVDPFQYGSCVVKRGTAFIPVVVACAFFMENFDGTVITTALPAMAASLHADPVALSVAVTAYLVSLAVFIPVSGWLADRFGASITFRAAIFVFTIASVCCALAANVTALVAARALQGMGGAMMLPVGRLIILRTFDRAQFVRAMSFVTTPALIGPMLGPPVGGFITTFLSWRWIFFLNVPIGVLGIVLAWLWIGNDHEDEARPFDGVGFALTGISVTSVMVAFDSVVRGDGGWTTRVLFAGGVAFGIAAFVHARRATWPIVDVSLLHVRTFAASMGPGNLFRASMFATPFLLPLLLQVGLGMSAFESGSLTLAAAAGALTMKAAAPYLLRRFGFRTVLTGNGILTGLSTLAIATFGNATHIVLMVVVILLFGTGRSLQLSALNSFTFASVPAPKMSAATSFSAMLQQLAAGIGIAASAFLVHAIIAVRHAPVTAIDASDIRFAIVITAIVAIAASVAFLRIDPASGDDITGHDATPRRVLSPRAL
jgi:EmrB/QacA subfamily drug resistance transporter